MDSPADSRLCPSCQDFTAEIARGWSTPDDQPFAYSPRWQRLNLGFDGSPGQTFGPGFQLHDSLDQLAQAAQDECALCALILQAFHRDDQAITTGALLLHPVRIMRGGSAVGIFQFTAAFADETDGPRRQKAPVPWRAQPRTFQVGLLRRGDDSDWDAIAPAVNWRAPPIDGWDEAVFATARGWIVECGASHEKCNAWGNAHELPSRLIDVGVHEDDDPRLHITTPDDTVPYAALSHCWGGRIDFRLTLDTLAAKADGMPLAALPRNFRDAVLATRRLGLRHLWIDALCIIQDSPADWKYEAARMMSVYANAAVTISALDSPASSAGFVHADRGTGPVRAAGGRFEIQELRPQFGHVVDACALSTRGWCLQERLLAPRIVHFGRGQIYWECQTCSRSEDDAGCMDSDPRVLDFASARRDFAGPGRGQGEDALWLLHKAWYLVVEEYTTRDLTFADDTFPAIAGAANKVIEAATEPHTYAAGLWVEDMVEGLLWGPKKVTLMMRKAPGFNNCHELRRVEEKDRRAPSWSWASVKGPVQYDYAESRSPDGIRCTVLDVSLASGLGDPMAVNARDGTIRIRGPVAPAWYQAPPYPDWDVGRLGFGTGPEDTPYLSCCVMDVDRFEPRPCFGLIARMGGAGSVAILVLEKVDGAEGRFWRIGICTPYENVSDVLGEKMKMFEEREIELV